MSFKCHPERKLLRKQISEFFQFIQKSNGDVTVGYQFG
jgi:hypothetical protein